jgi:Tetratricopeptide repeat
VRRVKHALVGVLPLTFLLVAGPVSAQDDQSQSQASQQETRKTPAMRERVYSRLSQAQTCAEMDDYACAQKLLEEVRAMTDLNSYEKAQMWNFYAYIAFNQDNFPQAISAYENVLKQEDLPLGLETTTTYTLCQLYFQQEQYDKSLELLNHWFMVAENPGPEAYVLQAQIYYQLQRYRDGIKPVETAIELAQQQGKEVQENWYRLLNVFYYELEDYPNVVKVLRTMIQKWPKREYIVQLAGMFGEQDKDVEQLSMFEVAYEAGWLTRGTELVNYAQMLLQADIPYKAATVLQKGLDSGAIESTDSNWRLLAQSWQLAQDDNKAIPALTRAASLASDGTLDVLLAQSYQNVSKWQNCADAARKGIDKGGLRREDQANMILGGCLFELKQYEQARNAFRAASSDQRSRAGAENWLKYIEAEQDRERQLAQAMRRG